MTTYTMADHSVKCQAKMMITAIENIRDIEGTTPTEFRIHMQDGYPVHCVDGYLEDTLMAEDICTCTVKYLERVKSMYFEADDEGRSAQQMARDYHQNQTITNTDFAHIIGWLQRTIDADREVKNETGWTGR